MIIGIDATNILDGGGITHLSEILNKIDIVNHKVDNIIIWGNEYLRSSIYKNSKLIIIIEKGLDTSYLKRMYWQKFILPKSLKKFNVNILFVPGGVYLGNFRPFVVMGQNLLPFDYEIRRKFRFATYLRLILIEHLQMFTFQNASGIIFVSEYSKNKILKNKRDMINKSIAIHHGINRDLFRPKESQEIMSRRLHLLYVSIINVYKNQIEVIQAVQILKEKGYDMQLVLIGGHYTPYLMKVDSLIKKIDPENKFIKYIKKIEYSKIAKYYNEADIFVFASVCETFGLILLEAMASKLPIACSNKSSLPEILGESGVYFDPNDPFEIAQMIEKLIVDKELREELSIKAYNRASCFSWENCASETFSFIEQTLQSFRKENEGPKT